MALFAKRSSILMPIIYGVPRRPEIAGAFFGFGELGQEVHKFFSVVVERGALQNWRYLGKESLEVRRIGMSH